MQKKYRFKDFNRDVFLAAKNKKTFKEVKMDRAREDRILGIVALFIFSTIGSTGVYLLQLFPQFSWGSFLGWLMCAAGFFMFFEATRFTDRVCLHHPEKRVSLMWLFVVFGVVVALFATGLDAEFRLTPIQMAIAVFGIGWVFSGAYLANPRRMFF